MQRHLLTARLLALAIGACACSCDTLTDVGEDCAISSADDGQMTLDTASPQCQSRLCVRFDIYSTNARPMCTSICEDAGDCPAADARCAAGYGCVVSQMVAGPMQCKKICVCGSDLAANEGDLWGSNCTR